MVSRGREGKIRFVECDLAHVIATYKSTYSCMDRSGGGDDVYCCFRTSLGGRRREKRPMFRLSQFDEVGTNADCIIPAGNISISSRFAARRETVSEKDGIIRCFETSSFIRAR
jgi:hypothetical protein